MINSVNMMLTSSEVAFVLKDCGAQALVTSAEKAAQLGGAFQVGHHIARVTAFSRVFDLGDDPSFAIPAAGCELRQEAGLKHMIVFGGRVPAGSTPFDDLTSAKAIAPVAADTLSLSTIAYTSGTTGHPKGAMHSHRSVIVNSEMTALNNASF